MTGSLADRIGAEAWDAIGGSVPADLQGEGFSSGDEIASASDLFEDVGERLQLGTPTSASYARVVLEAISEIMPPDDRERLGRFWQMNTSPCSKSTIGDDRRGRERR